MGNYTFVSLMNIRCKNHHENIHMLNPTVYSIFKEQHVTKPAYPRTECKEFLTLGNPQCYLAH